MNSRILLVVALVCGGLFSTKVFAAERTPLHKGMTADAVIQAVGRPQEVKPMKAPDGQAEVWTYRRVFRRDTYQVATGVEEVPAFVWINGPLGTAKEVTYSIRNATTYQVTSLLMFNGQLVHAKQWFERESGSYQ